MTWQNKRGSNNHIAKRFDRCLAEPQFLFHYQNAVIFHLEDIGSNYRPISFDLQLNSPRAKWFFKFDA